MVEKAAPMMMPTAMSTTLPRSANSLNSLSTAASLPDRMRLRRELAMIERQSHPGGSRDGRLRLSPVCKRWPSW
jgi:hypothetical protein